MSDAEQPEKPYKGKLKQAKLQRIGSVYCLHGISEGHPELDGHTIRTSYLMKVDFTVDPPIAETKNSLYEVLDL